MLQLGLIGRKLGHSHSPGIFSTIRKNSGIALSYRLFELASLEEFDAFLAKHPTLTGFNVTIPYKTALLPYLHAWSEAVEQIGAVNTVRILSDGRLAGFNTDYLGFAADLAAALGEETVKRVLVLGNGGSAKAIRYALEEQFGLRPQAIDTASRSPEPEQQLHVIDYATASERLASYDLVVNTTPAGMHPAPQAAPPLTLQRLRASTLLYDLIYNPPTTTLMRAFAARGCSVMNGAGMLQKQAEAAFEYWRMPEQDLPPLQQNPHSRG